MKGEGGERGGGKMKRNVCVCGGGGGGGEIKKYSFQSIRRPQNTRCVCV